MQTSLLHIAGGKPSYAILGGDMSSGYVHQHRLDIEGHLDVGSIMKCPNEFWTTKRVRGPPTTKSGCVSGAYHFQLIRSTFFSTMANEYSGVLCKNHVLSFHGRRSGFWTNISLSSIPSQWCSNLGSSLNDERAIFS